MTAGIREYSRRKTYQELTFTDDFMFRKVLRNDKDLCRRLVELLLDVKIDHIVYKDDEYSIVTSSDNKGVRLDVYLRDDEGTVFDLEMQSSNSKVLPKRSRYYQSMIDIDCLLSGEDYEELPDSYIVFICTFDPYDSDLPKYEFRELCLEDNTLELGTGTSKVFINAKSKSRDISPEMRSFLDYLCGKAASSSLTEDIESGVKYAKANRPWEMEYMTLADKLRIERKEGRAEGLAEGHAEGLAEGTRKARFEDVALIVTEGLCDEIEACDLLGVSIDEYHRYLEELQN